MNKILISVGLALALAGPGLLPAQAQTSAALTGQVSSGEEGPMEGVLISAKKAGAGKRKGETKGHQELVHAHRSFPK